MYGREGYWRMKNGREVEIKSMTTPHIRNCLNLIDKCIAEGLNRAMSMNEEIEVPEDLENKRYELATELEVRYKRKKRK